uniref:Adenylate kinase n=1 Tax=Arcella intermedia TaxID=1963864 RepID=A0A6B2LKH0_9EUKA
MGGPGSGKSTQGDILASKYGYLHISAGELLRQEMATPNSDKAPIIRSRIDNGMIVPAQITLSLLLEKMKGSEKRVFLIDGFPRNLDNLNTFDGDEECKGYEVPFVVYFNCEERVLVERIMERAKTSGRSDDTLESLRLRLKTYKEQTQPIIEHYRKEGKLIEVDAGKSASDISQDVDSFFHQRLHSL